MSITTIDAAATPERVAGVRFRRVATGLMLILDSRVFELNETAELAWTLCTGDQSFAAIVAKVAEEYDATEEQVRADLEELFAQLVEIGALTAD